MIFRGVNALKSILVIIEYILSVVDLFLNINKWSLSESRLSDSLQSEEAGVL